MRGSRFVVVGLVAALWAINPRPASNGLYELGLTVTYENMGDYANRNTENVVFQFGQNGEINYKKWLRSSDTFTQGQAVVINCPAS